MDAAGMSESSSMRKPDFNPGLPRVLHLFSRYLDVSMNWAWLLLKNTNARHTIAAEAYTSNKEFRPPAFKYLLPVFNSRRSPFAFFNYHYLRQRLKGELKEQDIVHAHFASIAWKYLSLVKASGKPLAVSFYGHDYESL